MEQWSVDTAVVEPVDGGAMGGALARAGDPRARVRSTRCSTRPRISEPGVARALARGLPAGGALVASSSMPIRDLEWYVHPDHELAVHANRGANGIDGVVSTAVGVALGDYSRPTALLIGDLAFLHDSNGLLGAAQREHRPRDRRGRQRRWRHLLVPPAGRVRRARALRAALRHAARSRPRRPGPVLRRRPPAEVGRRRARRPRRAREPAASTSSSPAPTAARTSRSTTASTPPSPTPSPALTSHLTPAARSATVVPQVPSATSLRPDVRSRDGRVRGSDPGEGAEHGLELDLGLGELGVGVAVGDDAVAGDEASRGAVDVGAADADREGAVAAGVDPADRAGVAAAVEALVAPRSRRGPRRGASR